MGTLGPPPAGSLALWPPNFSPTLVTTLPRTSGPAAAAPTGGPGWSCCRFAPRSLPFSLPRARGRRARAAAGSPLTQALPQTWPRPVRPRIKQSGFGAGETLPGDSYITRCVLPSLPRVPVFQRVDRSELLKCRLPLPLQQIVLDPSWVRDRFQALGGGGGGSAINNRQNPFM